MKLKYLLAASVVSLSATTMVAAPAAAQQIERHEREKTRRLAESVGTEQARWVSSNDLTTWGQVAANAPLAVRSIKRLFRHAFCNTTPH